jgi:hypothetical protein
MSLFDEASLIVTPNAFKASKLYSIKPTDGSGDLTVTRATTATRVDENGLIEIPVTNLILRSEEFSQSPWNSNSISITPNTILSPDGTLTADTFTANGASATHNLFQSISFVAGTTYTISLFVKKNTNNFIQITSSTNALGSTFFANFDIENGTLGTRGANAISSSIENYGNGWYRISATGVGQNTASNPSVFIITDSANAARNQSNTLSTSLYIWGAQVEESVTAREYIPTTSVIRTKFQGITQDGGSASNIPRLDYTNSTCPSILVEPQRTNLVLRSEEFDNASWNFNFNRTSITPNRGISPNGTNNAYLFTKGLQIVNILGWNGQQISITNGTTYQFTCYFKKGTIGNLALIRIAGLSFPPAIFGIFNFDTGSFESGSSANAKAQLLSNGWYRISIFQTATSNGTGDFQIGCSGNSTNVLMWGAQVEAGSNATSYIPSTTGIVTRNADVISKTGISSLIGQTEGTIFAQIRVSRLLGTASRYIFHLSDGTTNNRIYMAFSGASSNILRARIFNGGVLQANIESSTITTLGTYKLALAYKNNDIVFYINGVQIGTDASATIPTCSRVDLGQNFANASQFNDGISNANIWKTRLTNAELAQLTTL